MHVSIVIPAKNEARNLETLLPKLRKQLPSAQITVVDDGSADDTVNVCHANSVDVVSHPYSIGNGGAVKSGARASTGDVLVFLDGDGQHKPEDIPLLIQAYEKGYDMIVGAREKSTHASFARRIANSIYNWLATRMVGHKVADLTSGFRIVNAKKFKEFLFLLPNGFSYPTSITMAFFRMGYQVGYVPIQAQKRQGKSHISLLRDGAKFFIIIFRVGTLYSPLKIFLPVSVTFFLTGLGYYGYTFLTAGRLTNMTVLLFTTSVLVFLIGLVSEQVSTLLFAKKEQ